MIALALSRILELGGTVMEEWPTNRWLWAFGQDC
jgi:hypothetical protein